MIFESPRVPQKKIEEMSLAWRDALAVPNTWAPDMVRLVEIGLSKILPASFALVVRNDDEMDGAEAYTEFNPAHIAVAKSVYFLARKHDGRSRMTFAHELGHLVMHVSDGPRPRMVQPEKKKEIKPFESAEWQANKFASLFLMPEHVVREFNTVDELIVGCKVSRQAAEIRFNEVGHIKKIIPDCAKMLGADLDALQPAPPRPTLIK